jgi:hypothetical protein
LQSISDSFYYNVREFLAHNAKSNPSVQVPAGSQGLFLNFKGKICGKNTEGAGAAPTKVAITAILGSSKNL